MERDKSFLNHEELLARERDVRVLDDAYSRLSDEPVRALKQFETLANNGSVLSMLYLANRYQRGPFEDLAKAEKWYRAAYEQRALNAVFGLGGLYYRQERLGAAEAVFSDGAANGDGVSMYWLASLYVKQGLLESKSEEIRNLLERSAALGQVNAKNQLGILYMKGRFGGRYLLRGLFLYLRSILDAFRVGYKDPDSRLLW
jgi:TPR repeat protein